ncbi:hypothetical protein PFFCH_02022 [Plasmodium falciparum FCH/4]|uniref:Uncharacterized protein n=1 Tax=Plasmodium falciparum FCH/4 TaxID=1036724 RepID=A0A024VRM1_PLAFA|nr:hypothetical protein PFFCH_02022 [Plasmodium falciparum FCH/4]
MTYVGHDCASKCYVGQENSNSKVRLRLQNDSR